MASHNSGPPRLADLVFTSLSQSPGLDPVRRQLLPMFGLRSTGFSKGIRRLEEKERPRNSGFRTSLYPKSPLTPEIENKLKAISLYQALLRSSKGDLKFFTRNRHRCTSQNRRPSYGTSKHLTQRSLSQVTPEPERAVLYATEVLPEPSRKAVPVLPVICTALSPKSRLTAAASRESHISIPTPLAPIYTRSTALSRAPHLSPPLRRLRQSV